MRKGALELKEILVIFVTLLVIAFASYLILARILGG